MDNFYLNINSDQYVEISRFLKESADEGISDEWRMSSRSGARDFNCHWAFLSLNVILILQYYL